MTISRWERGLLQPSAEHFIQLGNLGSKNEAWFFWEMAGVQASKMIDALGTSSGNGRRLQVAHIQRAKAVFPDKTSQVVGLPLLKGVIGTHGVQSDRRSSLRTIPATQILG
ncbi:MAG TPA: hypothetical protein VKB60_09620, partial [Terriglobales bacterium]|nr:hypothetical protein [Terriglobales bacterium]